MTLLLEQRRTEITRTPVMRHVTEWVMGVEGVLAAAVGAYMFYAPTDWLLADLAEGWYLGMWTAAGLFLAAAFGVFARKAYLGDRSWTGWTMLATGLATAALAGAAIFTVIWVV